MSEEQEYQHKPEKTKNYREKIMEKIRKGESVTKKRAAIKRVSAKRSQALREYEKSSPLNGLNCCSNCGAHNGVERHHPYGRSGNNITRWVWVCSEATGCHLHGKIHQNPDRAFEKGWLQPEYRGLDPNLFPDHPKPWGDEN